MKLHAAEIPWAYVTGTVAIPARQWVAVTVNGTIAGMAQTLPVGSGTSQYAAVLPPSLVREGKNDIEVFTVTGNPFAPVLAPTRLER